MGRGNGSQADAGGSNETLIAVLPYYHKAAPVE